ncbi:hypothetical protein RI367_007503 [Sorochytrium milnesiophthora]
MSPATVNLSAPHNGSSSSSSSSGSNFTDAEIRALKKIFRDVDLYRTGQIRYTQLLLCIRRSQDVVVVNTHRHGSGAAGGSTTRLASSASAASVAIGPNGHQAFDRAALNAALFGVHAGGNELNTVKKNAVFDEDAYLRVLRFVYFPHEQHSIRVEGAEDGDADAQCEQQQQKQEGDSGPSSSRRSALAGGGGGGSTTRLDAGHRAQSAVTPSGFARPMKPKARERAATAGQSEQPRLSSIHDVSEGRPKSTAVSTSNTSLGSSSRLTDETEARSRHASTAAQHHYQNSRPASPLKYGAIRAHSITLTEPQDEPLQPSGEQSPDRDRRTRMGSDYALPTYRSAVELGDLRASSSQAVPSEKVGLLAPTATTPIRQSTSSAEVPLLQLATPSAPPRPHSAAGALEHPPGVRHSPSLLGDASTSPQSTESGARRHLSLQPLALYARENPDAAPLLELQPATSATALSPTPSSAKSMKPAKLRRKSDIRRQSQNVNADGSNSSVPDIVKPPPAVPTAGEQGAQASSCPAIREHKVKFVAMVASMHMSMLIGGLVTYGGLAPWTSNLQLGAPPAHLVQLGAAWLPCMRPLAGTSSVATFNDTQWSPRTMQVAQEWTPARLADVCAMGGFGADGLPDQWWRLGIAWVSPAGIVPAVFYAVILGTVGQYLERQVGVWIVGSVYVLSGLSGILLSIVMAPDRVANGPGGAVFGLLGLWQWEWWWIRQHLQRHRRQQQDVTSNHTGLAPRVVLFLLTLSAGLLPFINNYINIGGACCGVVLGGALTAAGGIHLGAIPTTSASGMQRWKQVVLRSGCVVAAAIAVLACLLVWALRSMTHAVQCPQCSGMDCVPVDSAWCADGPFFVT